MERYIDTHIYINFSPDEDIWFLERREPGNWAVSEQEFNTDLEAEQAYQAGEIDWEVT